MATKSVTRQQWLDQHLVESGSDLTPEQADRLARTVAILSAEREAFRAGASLAEVEAQTWLVEVHALDPQPL